MIYFLQEVGAEGEVSLSSLHHQIQLTRDALLWNRMRCRPGLHIETLEKSYKVTLT